jgi:hypothetical protein
MTDNVLIYLMWSDLHINWPSPITVNKLLNVSFRFSYCYHSVIVISFSLFQSNHKLIRKNENEIFHLFQKVLNCKAISLKLLIWIFEYLNGQKLFNSRIPRKIEKLDT